MDGQTSGFSYWLEKIEWIGTYPACNALNGTQREIPLTSLDSSEVGTVHPDYLGKGLLRKPLLLS